MKLPFVSRKEYEEVVYKLESLLYHATGGRLSKHTYPLGTMEREVTDYIDRCCDDSVTRCKDCVHWGGATYGFVCRKFSGIETKICMGADHYCSYAERKSKWEKL